eukprot:gene4292-4577_t
MLWVEFDFEIPMKDVEKILRDADVDRSGQIDLSEFLDFYPRMKKMSWFRKADKARKEREDRKAKAGDPYAANEEDDTAEVIVAWTTLDASIFLTLDDCQVAAISAICKACSSLSVCDDLLKPKPLKKPAMEGGSPTVDVHLSTKCEKARHADCKMRGCNCECHSGEDKTLFENHLDAIMQELDVTKSGKIMRAEMYFALSHIARELNMKQSDRALFFREIDDDRSGNIDRAELSKLVYRLVEHKRKPLAKKAADRAAREKARQEEKKRREAERSGGKMQEPLGDAAVQVEGMQRLLTLAPYLLSLVSVLQNQ